MCHCAKLILFAFSITPSSQITTHSDKFATGARKSREISPLSTQPQYFGIGIMFAKGRYVNNSNINICLPADWPKL
jgi:hypothetical protein